MPKRLTLCALGGVLAFNPATTAAIPGTGNLQVVAMGDSFTSGHNNASPNTPPDNSASSEIPQGNCRRDDPGYADMVAGQLGIHDFIKVACSGASPEQIINGRWNDGSQINALSNKTDYVLITLGANAGDLTRLLQDCLTAANCSVDTDPMRTFLQDAASVAYQEKIGDTLTTITENAPNAHVIVVPYPAIIDPDAWCGTLISKEADQFADTYIKTVNATLATVVEGMSAKDPLAKVHLAEQAIGTDLCRSFGTTFFHDLDDPRSLGHPTKDGYLKMSFPVEELVRDIERGRDLVEAS